MRPFLDFPPESFRRRREEVLRRLDGGAMLVPAAPLLVRAGDAELPYRPDSELFYLSGFTEPEALLVLRGFAGEERSVLFVRPRDAKSEQWTGERMGPGRAAEELGVAAAYPMGELEERLPKLLEGADRLHHRLGIHPRLDRIMVEALAAARRRGQREGKGPRGVIDPGEILDEMRLVKDSDELAAIREAVRVTVTGFRWMFAAVEPGMGEWEVEAGIEAAFRRGGARAPAFATIVGSGPNACTLHYVENARRLGEGELLLVDAGAEVRLYAGDLSRTVPVSGRFSAPQRELYIVVDEARRAAIRAIRPGATPEGVHRVATERLVEGLRDLGILEGDVEELVEGDAHRPFFPHNTSHWLGLNTHDPGDYVRDGDPRRLEPGMVLTVEPGLYLPGGGAAPGGEDPIVPEAFQGLGIRLEDDVLVTETGCEVLSAELPTGPDEVEGALRGSSSSSPSP